MSTAGQNEAAADPNPGTGTSEDGTDKAGRRRRKGSNKGAPRGGADNRGHRAGPGVGGPRMKKVLAEVDDLRARVVQLEQDIEQSRRLNKRLAEVTDVVAEVLLPVGQRDDARIRELLANYDRAL